MGHSKKPLYLIAYRSFPYKKSRENVEISEKVRKSPIKRAKRSFSKFSCSEKITGKMGRSPPGPLCVGRSILLI